MFHLHFLIIIIIFFASNIFNLSADKRKFEWCIWFTSRHSHWHFPWKNLNSEKAFDLEKYVASSIISNTLTKMKPSNVIFDVVATLVQSVDKFNCIRKNIKKYLKWKKMKLNYYLYFIWEPSFAGGPSWNLFLQYSLQYCVKVLG